MARGDGRDPFADETDDVLGEPVDVSAVRRDEQLLDLLASGRLPAADALADGSAGLDAHTAELLLGWRNAVTEVPLPAGPTLDAALAAVAAGRDEVAGGATSAPGNSTSAAAGPDGVVDLAAERRRRRLRVLRPLSAAAVAVGIAVAGMGIVSMSAQPGDPLWSVKSVVFSKQADSTVAQRQSDDQIAQAHSAVDAARYSDAARLLDEASQRAGAVSDQGQKDVLLRRIAELRGVIARAQEPAEEQATPVAPAPVPGEPTQGEVVPPVEPTVVSPAPTTTVVPGPTTTPAKPTEVKPTEVKPSSVVPTTVPSSVPAAEPKPAN